MNWKFIIRWVTVFTVATIVLTLTGRFLMALGVMILLAVGWSYVSYEIEKRKILKQLKDIDKEDDVGGSCLNYIRNGAATSQ